MQVNLGKLQRSALICLKHQASCSRHLEARNATVFTILIHNCRVQKLIWVSSAKNYQYHIDTKSFQGSLLVLKDSQWWLLLIPSLEFIEEVREMDSGLYLGSWSQAQPIHLQKISCYRVGGGKWGLYRVSQKRVQKWILEVIFGSVKNRLWVFLRALMLWSVQ